MGAAINLSIREQIVKQKLAGQTLKEISEQQGISYSATRKIWRLFQQKGMEGLVPQYANCGPQGPRYAYRMVRLSKWLKRHHPNWGAPVIRVILAKRYGEALVPSVRTLQVWFRAAGYSRPKSYRGEPKAIAVQQPHDCWQIDAKERLDLADGTKACYLTTGDVKSGAVLATPIFSQSSNEPSQTNSCETSFNPSV